MTGLREQWIDAGTDHLSRGIEQDDYYTAGRSIDSVWYAGNVSPIHSSPNIRSSGQHGGSEHFSGDCLTQGDLANIIDDLTLENARLKQHLRRCEDVQVSPVPSDVLFEVRFHAIPTSKRRDLEVMLQQFCCGLDLNQHPPPKSLKPAATPLIERPLAANRRFAVQKSSRQNSDSAYASMSTFEMKAKPIADSTVLDLKRCDHYCHADHGSDKATARPNSTTPDGDLRLAVVERLERLFRRPRKKETNADSTKLGEQRVPYANQVQSIDSCSLHGNRQAQILTESRTQSHHCGGNAYSPILTTDYLATAEQRPTRSTELDPDRDQNPSDNMQYIRHLGHPPPPLHQGNGGNALDVTDGGWIYLNLLTNMAQLHLMNVTSDFIRSAIAHSSSKFELSEDGKQIRWTEVLDDAQQHHRDSNIHKKRDSEGDEVSEYVSRKRRKLSSTVPTCLSLCHQVRTRNNLCASGSTASVASRTSTHPSSLAPTKIQHAAINKYHGSVVFYSGLRFCIDALGDDHYRAASVEDDVVDDDGSAHSEPLGRRTSTKAVEKPPASSSDSLMVLDSVRYWHGVTKASELLTDCLESHGLGHDMESYPDVPQENTNQNFDMHASGIGGIQPADHFVLRVKTSRILSHKHSKRNNTSFSHSRSSHRRFLQSSISKTLESLDERRTLGNTASPELSQSRLQLSTVSSRITSAEFNRLPASQLPPPTAYYESPSSSIDSMDDSSDTLSFDAQ